MITKKRIRIVSVLFFLAGVSTISYAQTANANNVGKTIISFSGLKYADIGAATKAGNATNNKDEIRIVAGGTDIWGKHDEFHFGYKTLKGDFDLSVQILSLSAANK